MYLMQSWSLDTAAVGPFYSVDGDGVTPTAMGLRLRRRSRRRRRRRSSHHRHRRRLAIKSGPCPWALGLCSAWSRPRTSCSSPPAPSWALASATGTPPQSCGSWSADDRHWTDEPSSPPRSSAAWPVARRPTCDGSSAAVRRWSPPWEVPASSSTSAIVCPSPVAKTTCPTKNSTWNVLTELHWIPTHSTELVQCSHNLTGHWPLVISLVNYLP